MKSTISHVIKIARFCGEVEIDNETDVVYSTGAIRTFVTDEWHKERIPNTVIAFIESAKSVEEMIKYEAFGKHYKSILTYYYPLQVCEANWLTGGEQR